MATETIIVTWCDPCLSTDLKVEGENYPVAFAGSPRIVGLCAPHYKEFYEPLLLLVEDLGQPAVEDAQKPPQSGSKAPSKQSVDCLECGKTLTTLEGLRKHIRRTHHMTLPDYHARHPEAFGVMALPAHISCPLCSKVYSHDLGNTRPRQALSIHLRKRHNKKLAEVGL